MHMKVDDETAKLLTVNTTRELFKVTRLNYGVQSALAKWQRFVENVFKLIAGCRCFYDDIKISSSDHRIRAFFAICRENFIRLRREKCQFLSKELEYLGFKLDEKGVHKTSGKVDTVLRAPPPRNVSEVKAFTGLVVFYARFLRNMSEILQPIQTLKQSKRVPLSLTKESKLQSMPL